MPFKLSYKRFGEQAILVEWPKHIDEDILSDLLLFKKKLTTHYEGAAVQINHAYNSILIDYERVNFRFGDEVAALKQVYKTNVTESRLAHNLWKIPVCYNKVFGIDLEALSEVKNITEEEIIQRHTKVTYTVYFIGFLPGFLYLGGLEETLHMPRKATPRLQIEKGAVAIGGNQTGVYPNASPGGWHIIGNSPINFFDITKDCPCFAKAGDRIQFVPVDLKVYEGIKALVDAGVYQLESEVLHG
ncbi:5-oxoprolinase subunit PxpB [Aestuariivivens insulae]|uniref:5-oxoprolinase subunit PxpB n=1 Tax=Aestuariivivens insulae TaxID=1621988 RepID=UPI001F568BB1|nr:5-oxoprolinase subunit PxpB [Aestuariivivens insulae]